MTSTALAKTLTIQELTIEEVREALPMNHKHSVTKELVDKLNNISSDLAIGNQIRENFITYKDVLTTGKYNVMDYVNAVHFVSYRMMGLLNKDAYIRTFPDRYAEHVAANRTEKEISAYVSMYAKGKLVSSVYERSLIPVYVRYQDVYHQAILTQVGLMQNSASEKVRQEAANSLLTHLAKPKDAAINNQLNVQINQNESSATNQLFETINKLVAIQQTNVADGKPLKDMLREPIIAKPKEEDVVDV